MVKLWLGYAQYLGKKVSIYYLEETVYLKNKTYVFYLLNFTRNNKL